MNWMQKFGGRKFILALLSGLTAVVLVINRPDSFTPTLAGFLIALVGLFNISNNMATKTYMESGTVDSDEVMKSLEEIKTLATSATDQAAVQQLVQLLQGINTGITDVKQSNAQIGQALLRRSQ